MRSGVTVLLARGPEGLVEPCYAGMHTLNGNGEVTGGYQVKDWGFINTVRFAVSNSLVQSWFAVLMFKYFLLL